MTWWKALLLTVAIHVAAVFFYAVLEVIEPRGRDIYELSVGALAAFALFRTFYKTSGSKQDSGTGAK